VWTRDRCRPSNGITLVLFCESRGKEFFNSHGLFTAITDAAISRSIKQIVPPGRSAQSCLRPGEGEKSRPELATEMAWLLITFVTS
jgi:hypothetical protein